LRLFFFELRSSALNKAKREMILTGKPGSFAFRFKSSKANVSKHEQRRRHLVASSVLCITLTVVVLGVSRDANGQGAEDPAANPVVLRGHKGWVWAVAISPNNHWVVTGDSNTARLWDLSAKDPAANPVVLRGHEGLVRAVAISPDSHWVVTGSYDGTARLWDLTKLTAF
jgi:WD40 repeat protein